MNFGLLELLGLTSGLIKILLSLSFINKIHISCCYPPFSSLHLRKLELFYLLNMMRDLLILALYYSPFLIIVYF